MKNPNIIQNDAVLDEELELPERRPLEDFLGEMRDEGLQVSTPEWLSFLAVVESLGQSSAIMDGKFFQSLKAVGAATLVKKREDLAHFSEIFDEFFRQGSEVEDGEKEDERKRDEVDGGEVFDGEAVDEQRERERKIGADVLQAVEAEGMEEARESEEPELKESLGIQDVDENMQVEGEEHDDNENIHGGKKDQHNDILKQEDEKKIGGGNLRHTEEGTGQGESASRRTGEDQDRGEKEGTGQGVGFEHRSGERGIGRGDSDLRRENQIVYEADEKKLQISQETRNVDWRKRYDIHPNGQNVKMIVERLKQIVEDATELSTGKIDVDRTVNDFARKDFRITYEQEREKEPRIVLLIDVGGPVDYWRPAMEELVQGMSTGLAKLETYCFHNQLYGYCWKPTDDNYAAPHGLKDLRKIIQHDKKVIIYGDAEMASDEMIKDFYPPSRNERELEKYTMDGLDCLKFIKKKADNVVWINPEIKMMAGFGESGLNQAAIDKRREDEYGGYNVELTISEIADIIPMYGLSIGGVEDAVTALMRK